MEAKLLKIKLRANSRDQLDSLISYMRKNIEYPKKEMEQKGYFWDSVFYEKNEVFEYIYIVIKLADFSNIMLDESELIVSPFRDVYEKFRSQCWASEPYLDLEPIFCFNSSITFSN